MEIAEKEGEFTGDDANNSVSVVLAGIPQNKGGIFLGPIAFTKDSCRKV
jgi:hypothetical protein